MTVKKWYTFEEEKEQQIVVVGSALTGYDEHMFYGSSGGLMWVVGSSEYTMPSMNFIADSSDPIVTSGSVIKAPFSWDGIGGVLISGEIRVAGIESDYHDYVSKSGMYTGYQDVVQPDYYDIVTSGSYLERRDPPELNGLAAIGGTFTKSEEYVYSGTWSWKISPNETETTVFLTSNEPRKFNMHGLKANHVYNISAAMKKESASDSLSYIVKYTNGELNGNYLSIVGVGEPSMAYLTPNRIAFIHSNNYLLTTYEFDGIYWTQIGNTFNVGATSYLCITSLSETRIALSSSTGGRLETYEFNGTDWSKVGSTFSLGTTTWLSITKMSSSRIAFFDTSAVQLRAYDFNGTVWSLVGSGLTISGSGKPSLASLTSDTIAFIDGTHDELRTYQFNGTSWSQVGNSYIVPAAESPYLTAMSASRIAFSDANLDILRTYDWNGTDWYQVSVDFPIGTVTNYCPMVYLGDNKIALIYNPLGHLEVFEFYKPSEGLGNWEHAPGWQTLSKLEPSTTSWELESSTISIPFDAVGVEVYIKANTYYSNDFYMDNIVFEEVPQIDGYVTYNSDYEKTSTKSYSGLYSHKLTNNDDESRLVLSYGSGPEDMHSFKEGYDYNISIALLRYASDHDLSFKIDYNEGQLVSEYNFLPAAATNKKTIAALTKDTISFIDNYDDSIKVYSLVEGSWSQVGSGLINSGYGVGMSALSETRIAFIDANSRRLRTFSWDGSAWSQIGNDFTIIGGLRYSIAALSSNRIAFTSDTGDLFAYDFDGTNWAQVGSGSTIGSAEGIAYMGNNRVAICYTSSKIEIFDFNGTNWTKIGNSRGVIAGISSSIAALNSDTIAFTNPGKITTYKFDGTDLLPVGNSLSINNRLYPSITCMRYNTIVYTSASSNSLLVYVFDGINWTLEKRWTNLISWTPSTLDWELFEETIHVPNSAKGVRTYIDSIGSSGYISYIDEMSIVGPKELDGYGYVVNGCSYDKDYVETYNNDFSWKITNAEPILEDSQVDIIKYNKASLHDFKIGSEYDLSISLKKQSLDYDYKFVVEYSSYANVPIKPIGTGSLNISITSLSSTRIALANTSNNRLSVYDFDGSIWSQVGYSVISYAEHNAISAMGNNRIAYLSSTANGFSIYEFDGTNWTLVLGSGKSVGATINYGTIAALTDYRVAITDHTTHLLKVFDWDGSSWTAIGNTFDLTVATAYPNITRLSATRIACISSGNNILKTLEFDGTNWTQVGNSLTTAASYMPSITALGNNTIAYLDGTWLALRTYEFNGVDWLQIGDSLSVDGATNSLPKLATLTPGKIVRFETTLEGMYTYEWDGNNWGVAKNWFNLLSLEPSTVSWEEFNTKFTIPDYATGIRMYLRSEAPYGAESHMENISITRSLDEKVELTPETNGATTVYGEILVNELNVVDTGNGILIARGGDIVTGFIGFSNYVWSGRDGAIISGNISPDEANLLGAVAASSIIASGGNSYYPEISRSGSSGGATSGGAGISNYILYFAGEDGAIISGSVGTGTPESIYNVSGLTIVSGAAYINPEITDYNFIGIGNTVTSGLAIANIDYDSYAVIGGLEATAIEANIEYVIERVGDGIFTITDGGTIIINPQEFFYIAVAYAIVTSGTADTNAYYIGLGDIASSGSANIAIDYIREVNGIAYISGSSVINGVEFYNPGDIYYSGKDGATAYGSVSIDELHVVQVGNGVFNITGRDIVSGVYTLYHDYIARPEGPTFGGTVAVDNYGTIETASGSIIVSSPVVKFWEIEFVRDMTGSAISSGTSIANSVERTYLISGSAITSGTSLADDLNAIYNEAGGQTVTSGESQMDDLEALYIVSGNGTITGSPDYDLELSYGSGGATIVSGAADTLVEV